jgi:hypothetical protein
MRKIVGLCLLLMLLVACGQNDGESDVTDVSDVEDATVVLTAPTDSPEPTVIVEITEPPPPPTVVIAEPATPTPIPTAEPTATPEATATPEPIVLLTGEDFAATGRNPFTGELLDPMLADQRPIACKISNSPAQWVRPQSGLNSADIIFEHLAEGIHTRFTALFYGQVPEKVGPVRSARLIDVEIPAMYDAALCFSGSSIGVSRKLNGSDLRPSLIRSYYEGYFRSGEEKPWEHTLYGEVEGFREELTKLEQNRAPELNTFMAFSNEPPVGGETATYIGIAYDTGTFVEWRWDDEQQRYLRWADGEPFLDANDGEQVGAANVVTVFASHTQDVDICELQVEDQCFSTSTEIQIWAQGFAAVYRDGQRFIGEWRRADRHDMLTFYDTEGNPLPLDIGQTWMQVLPYYYDDPVVYE